MGGDSSQESSQRRASLNFSKLLDEFATDSAVRAKLEQLLLTIQCALLRRLPLLARAKEAERRARIDQLTALQKAMGATAKALSERTGSKRRTVGGLLGREIARSMTDEAFRSAGITVYSSSRDREMNRARAREPEAEIAALERRQREALAIHSPVVLAKLLARCRALVSAQLAVEGKAKGGRPSLAEREYVLSSIASAFADIFGVAPTPTANGRFLKLSIAVLGVFEIDTHGVDAAAKRTVEKMRRAPSRSKPR